MEIPEEQIPSVYRGIHSTANKVFAILGVEEDGEYIRFEIWEKLASSSMLYLEDLLRKNPGLLRKNIGVDFVREEAIILRTALHEIQIEKKKQGIPLDTEELGNINCISLIVNEAIPA